jgi:hypothetical protein
MVPERERKAIINTHSDETESVVRISHATSH